MKNRVKKTLKDYEDMLHLPHHVSSHRPHMSLIDRAAQFSPFAAVVGHEKAVKEAARYTDQRKELDEMEKAMIDNQLREIEAQLPESPDVEIVYFEPDPLKSGGKYVTKVGQIKKLDSYEGMVLMEDGKKITIEEIYGLRL